MSQSSDPNIPSASQPNLETLAEVIALLRAGLNLSETSSQRGAEYLAQAIYRAVGYPKEVTDRMATTITRTQQPEPRKVPDEHLIFPIPSEQ